MWCEPSVPLLMREIFPPSRLRDACKIERSIWKIWLWMTVALSKISDGRNPGAPFLSWSSTTDGVRARVLMEFISPMKFTVLLDPAFLFPGWITALEHEFVYLRVVNISGKTAFKREKKVKNIIVLHRNSVRSPIVSSRMYAAIAP